MLKLLSAPLALAASPMATLRLMSPPAAASPIATLRLLRPLATAPLPIAVL
jgi:hypothetical protein